MQRLLQWRWDNERDAVLAEDAIEQQKKSETRMEALRERERQLKQATLEGLRVRRFFPRWKGYPPAKAIRASRKIMANAVEELQKLGLRASKKARMAILKSCIESFNALDVEMQFIETGEREDICEEFEAIVHACGLGSHKDLADEWRDW